MASVFTENFNTGGNGATITTNNTTYSVVGGTAPTFDNSTIINGSYSAKMLVSGATSTLKENFPLAVTHRFFRRYFKISAWPATSQNISLIRTRVGSTSQGQVVLGYTGTINIRDELNAVKATSTNVVPLNTWFRVEYELDGVNNLQNCRLFLNGDVNSTTPTETLSGGYTGGAFDKVEDGVGTTFTGTLWVDAVADDDATWVGPVASPNSTPTANAGVDQTVTSNDLVTLTGLASSDPENSIASYAWTQVGGPAVTLSNTAVAQPTFTPPLYSTTTLLTFGLIVTDSNGMVSTQDTVVITVNPLVSTSFYESFENGTNAAAMTTSNTTYSSFTGGPVFSNAAFVAGSYSGMSTSAGAASCIATQNLPSPVTDRYFRRYFRVSAWPTGATVLPLVRARNSTTTNTTAQIVMNTAGQIVLRDNNTAVATSSTIVAPNSWFRVEWHIAGGSSTQTARLFTDANYNGSTATETLSGAYTNGAFDRVVDGINVTTYVGTVWYDEVTDSAANWIGPSASANAAPTANAGTNTTYNPGDTVTLDGTGSSDPENALQTFEWVQISGTAVTLDATNIDQPSFTAPSVSGGTTLVFGLRVYDVAGARSAQSTVTITVTAPIVPVFTEKFEGGNNGDAMTTSNTAYSTFTGTCTIDSSQQILGSNSGKCFANGTVAAFMRETFASPVSERYFRRYFRVTAIPTSNVVLMRTRLSGTSTAQVLLISTGVLQLRDGSTTIITTDAVISVNSWFRLEWHVVGGGAQTLRLFQGNSLHSVTPTDTKVATVTTTTFDRIDDGAATAGYLGSVYVDEVCDYTNAWPGPAVGTNQPPNVNAGSDQQVLPGELVTLDGTGSVDPDGTIAAYSWSQTVGTSVTLSSASAAQPTFTAPSVSTGDLLTFKLTVTDNQGSQSLVGSVNVTVLPANEFVLHSGSWTPAPHVTM